MNIARRGRDRWHLVSLVRAVHTQKEVPHATRPKGVSYLGILRKAKLVVVSSPNKHKMFIISDHTREEEEFEISRPAHPGRNPEPNFPEKNEMSRAPRRWRAPHERELPAAAF